MNISLRKTTLSNGIAYGLPSAYKRLIISSIVSDSGTFVNNDTTSKLTMRYELLHGNCFKRSMKSSVDFNK